MKEQSCTIAGLKYDLTGKEGVNPLAVFLIATTIIASIFKVFYGWDQDESYIILLAYKIISGDIIFRDIWDLHQTSAIIPALLMAPYVNVTGTVKGVAVYLRIMTTALQVILSVFAYLKVKKYYLKRTAFVTAVFIANFLPRATEQMEYGLSTVVFSMISCFLLFELWKGEKHSGYTGAFTAGFFYAISVFVYPTMIITLPLFVYILFFKINPLCSVRIKYGIFFFLGCLLFAVLFLAYVLRYISISDFFLVLGEFGNTYDHPGFFPVFKQPQILVKSGLRILLMAAVPLMIFPVLRKVLKNSYHYCSLCLIIWSAAVVILNVTGIRPSGPFGLLERYIVFVMLTLLFIRDRKDSPLFWLFYAGGIACYMGSLMGSALYLNENAMFLEQSLFAMLIWMSESKKRDVNEKDDLLTYAAICFFMIGIIFSKGYFVRVNGTVPANIFDCDKKLDYGIFSGIMVPSYAAEDYEAHIAELNVLQEEKPAGLSMYIGNDPVYNFFIEGETTSAQYVGTAMPNGQWVDYYKVFEHSLPEYIYLDKSIWKHPDEFWKKEFGGYLHGKYEVSDESAHFYVVSGSR